VLVIPFPNKNTFNEPDIAPFLTIVLVPDDINTVVKIKLFVIKLNVIPNAFAVIAGNVMDMFAVGFIKTFSSNGKFNPVVVVMSFT
jgi:hypothetical protein